MLIALLTSSNSVSTDRALDTVSETVETLKAKTAGGIDGIAVSYCGELDHEKGIIHTPGSYPYNGRSPFRALLSEKTGLPVSLENDGNLVGAALWYLEQYMT